MSIPISRLLATIFASLLGLCVYLFRSEVRKTPILPSSATKWRFYIATAGGSIFLIPLLGLVFPRVLPVFGACFFIWPLAALWLAAGPIVYRGLSAYLLSVVAALSIFFWYMFWRSSGL